MLTKKQLQALVGCGEKEDCTGETCPMFETCDNDYTNRSATEAAQTALAYRVMLERLEWVDNDYCPICGQYKANGHANDCELVALLKEARSNTMPKYMFETKNKITHCTNCPMRDKETDDCNLQENCGDTWLEQMLDCPLKEVEHDA